MRRLKPVSIKDSGIPYVIANPTMIEMVINGLQSSLGEIDWMTKSFGKAVIMSEKFNQEGQEYTYPGMFIGEDKDYLNLMEMDNFGAYSFMLPRDPETVEDYQEGIQNTYSRRLSLIVWCNLQLVNPDRRDDFTETIKKELISVISNTVYDDNSDSGYVLSVVIEEIFDEPANIFEGFSYNLVDTQFMYYPYRGLRFDLRCSYVEDCTT